MRKKAKFVNVCQLWSLDGHYANMLIGQYFLVLKHQNFTMEKLQIINIDTGVNQGKYKASISQKIWKYFNITFHYA